MTTKEQIEEYGEKCAKLLLVLEGIPEDIETRFSVLDIQIVVCVDTMDALHSMRRRLRGCLGHWGDKLEQVWESGGRALASYESDDWPICIRLETPMAEFPKEITGDTCRFEPRIETRYSYVCTKTGA